MNKTQENKHALFICIFLIAATLAVYRQNSFTLFRHTLKTAANKALILNNMLNILEDQGKIDEAIDSFQQALRLNPDYTMAQ